MPAPPVSGEAVCDGSRDARDDHASALANTADVEVLVTGDRLIGILDAGCAALKGPQ